jgi:HK97 family phage major capsid protein
MVRMTTRETLPSVTTLTVQWAYNRRIMDIIHKAGKQIDSAASGSVIPFVVSTDSVDLMGDQIVQRGIETPSKRIPAQVDHSGRFADSIGFWDNLQVDKGGQTLADLHLLPRGTSPLVDLVWALRDHGALLAASVGMRVKKWEPIVDAISKKATGGRRFLQTVLHEISLVVSPANHEALEIMKSAYKLKPGSREEKALDKLVTKRLLFARSNAAPAVAPKSGTKLMKTIAEQIQEAEALLNELKDEQLDITKALGDETDEDAKAALSENGSAVAEKITKAIARIDQLKAIEASLVPRARPLGAPALVNKNNVTDHKVDGMNIVRSALCIYESYLSRQPLDEVLKSRYGGNEAVETVTNLVRAVQNPALTTVPQWAGVLTRETWGAFMELLAFDSVIPQMPMMKYSFDQYGKINIGRRNAQPSPNLASAFRGEGAPIRVGAVSLGLDSLTPKTAGVIGTFSMELFEQSTPNIETEIKAWIQEDTAQAIDSIFLSNQAGTTIQPAGIQNGVVPPNSAASTGNTAAQITADIRGRAQQLAANRMGKKGSTVWVMNPARLVGLQLATTAAGTLAFPTASSGTLLGYGIVTSNTVPADIVYLVDCSAVAFASAPPNFLGTEVATIHEEDAVPLPITDGAGVAAAPVRSLYQTYSSALRGVYKLDWKVMRPGAVQILTGVAW